MAITTLDPQAVLPTADGDLWVETLNDRRVHDLIESKAQIQLDLVSAYLRDLGMADDRFAVVDVGWTGRMSAIVSAIVVAESGHVPLNLHFGATGVTPEVDQLIDVERFAFDGVTRYAPMRNIVSCVEAFMTTGLERARGFVRNDDGTVSVDLVAPIDGVAGADRDRLHDAACRVAAALPTSDHRLARYLHDLDDLSEASAVIMTELWLRPTVREARAIGRLRFELDEKKLTLSPVASPFTVRNILDTSTVVRRQWRNGSIQISREPLRTCLKLAQRVTKIVRPTDLPVG
ncbi:MAG: hypothetical protein R2706_07695 [Acidimicrobiales bacterium]